MYSCGTVSRFSFRMLARQFFFVKGKMHEHARPLRKILAVLFRIQKNSNSSIKKILLRFSLKNISEKRAGLFERNLFERRSLHEGKIQKRSG